MVHFHAFPRSFPKHYPKVLRRFARFLGAGESRHPVTRHPRASGSDVIPSEGDVQASQQIELIGASDHQRPSHMS